MAGMVMRVILPVMMTMVVIVMMVVAMIVLRVTAALVIVRRRHIGTERVQGPADIACGV
jgi:hypothetical protein